MNDQEFDELVNRMKETHHPPPPVPRDRMWERIEAARESGAPRPRTAPWRRWLVPAAAAAALLVLGFNLGRLSRQPDAVPQVADLERMVPPATTDTSRDEASLLVRHSARDLYQRADLLLTDLKVSSCAASPDRDPVPQWAGGLLTRTRLLLDSPLSDEPDTKALLQDLELVLVRITALSTQDCVRDVERIRQDLDESATLDRLRLAAADRASRFI